MKSSIPPSTKEYKSQKKKKHFLAEYSIFTDKIYISSLKQTKNLYFFVFCNTLPCSYALYSPNAKRTKPLKIWNSLKKHFSHQISHFKGCPRFTRGQPFFCFI